MRTKTSHLGFLLATLLGLSFGLRLASQAGRPHEDGGRETAAVPTSAGVESAVDSTPESPLAQPERRGARDGRRPGPDHHDSRYAPSNDEVCVATGVESADARPVRGAQVAIFAVDDDRPRFPADAVAKADVNGIVYARTKLTGEVFAVAFAPGYRPMSSRVRATANESLELAPFVLQKGETIRGRVTAGEAPLAGAEIEATASATSDATEIDGGAIAWRLGHFVWAKVKVDSTSDGTYEVGGLEAGDHKLRVDTVRQRGAAIDVSKLQCVHATAPAQGIDFELPAARLEMSFQTARAPLCCVEVQIEAGDRQFTRTTDENGKITMMIQPALAYPVTAARGGYTTKHTQLRGLIDGERSAQTIELEPQQVRATLVVDDVGTTASNEATFVFHPRFPSAGESDFERTVQRDPGSQHFSIPAVPSGPWRVTMRSGRLLRSSGVDAQVPSIQLRTNCDADAVVDVPDSGVVSTTMTTVMRGYARLVAHDPNGKPLDVRGRLFDLRGDEIDGLLLSGRDRDGFVHSEGLERDGPTYVYSYLCGGPADLVLFREGYGTAKVRVVFQAGQVTPLDVALRPN